MLHLRCFSQFTVEIKHFKYKVFEGIFILSILQLKNYIFFQKAVTKKIKETEAESFSLKLYTTSIKNYLKRKKYSL